MQSGLIEGLEHRNLQNLWVKHTHMQPYCYTQSRRAGMSKGFGKVRGLNRHRQRRAWTTGTALALGEGRTCSNLSQSWQSHSESWAMPTVTVPSSLSLRPLSFQAVLGLCPPLPEVRTTQRWRVLLSQVSALSHCSSVVFLLFFFFPCLMASSFPYI